MIDWERDWAKANVETVTEALSVLANATGGVEQLLLDRTVDVIKQLQKVIRTFTNHLDIEWAEDEMEPPHDH